MKTHLFSLLILVNLSTHIFAMDELFDTNQKENLKDFSEWVAEYQTPIVAGSIIGLGAATSLYTKEIKYVVRAAGLSACFVLYQQLSAESETDKALQESREELKKSNQELQGSVDSLCSLVTSYKQQSDEITTMLTDQNKRLGEILVAVGQQSGKMDALQETVTAQTTALTEIRKDLDECKAQSTSLLKETLNLKQSASDSTNILEDVRKQTEGLSADIARAYSNSTASILKELVKTLQHDQTKNMHLKNGN